MKTEFRHKILFLLPLLYGAAIYLLRQANWSLYEKLSYEDGPLEWLQFAAYFGAAVYFLASWRLLAKHSAAVNGLRRFILLMGLGAFVIAMEEISWGQRIFQIATPEPLEALNRQRELNLHNVEGIEGHIHTFYIVVGFLFSFGRLLLDRRRQHSLYQRLDPFLPPAYLLWYFYPIAWVNLFDYANMDLYALWLSTKPEFSFIMEYFELLFATGLCLYGRASFERFRPAHKKGINIIDN